MEDDDASLILQFENAVMDTIQDDKELATFFVSYQDARKRLLEKTRSRGFWPPRPFKGGKKGKGKASKGNPKDFLVACQFLAPFVRPTGTLESRAPQRENIHEQRLQSDPHVGGRRVELLLQ